MSLAVVLPCEPVTATTAAAPDARRGRQPAAPSRTTGPAPAGRPGRRRPARWARRWPGCRARRRRRPSTAATAWSWPSTCSPAKATKSPPGSGARLSRKAGPSTHQPRVGVDHPAADDLGDLGQGQRDHRTHLRSAGAQLVAVVEGVHHAPDLLAGLVALAGDHHGVAGSGQRHDLADRRAAVADLAHLGPLDHGGPEQHRGPDRGGVLGARVVVGDHEHVGEPGPDLAHHRSLAGVPVAAGTEHQQQPARVSGRSADSAASTASGLWA